MYTIVRKESDRNVIVGSDDYTSAFLCNTLEEANKRQSELTKLYPYMKYVIYELKPVDLPIIHK